MSNGLDQQFKQGTELPSLNKGRFTCSHLVRWCAAQQNWDKVHYNQDYARKLSGHEDVIINGALKQQFLVQFLIQAFQEKGWVWRVDYRFTGVDLVSQQLEVRGTVKKVEENDEHLFVHVAFEIHNLDSGSVTTTGDAIVVLASNGEPVTDMLDRDTPKGTRLDQNVNEVSGEVPEVIASRIGETLEEVESYIPVDLSRLKLFAAAVMNLPEYFYNQAAAQSSPYGEVVGFPLYPLHGLESLPGERELSTDEKAVGREGVNEVGRLDPGLFKLGINPAGLLNGGNKVEIHSLVRPGEFICAKSVLSSANHRVGRRAGPMLLLETVNHYWESKGRPLLTERQTMVYRLLGEHPA